MNAYELADDVLDINTLVTRQTVANALRQQATEKAGLQTALDISTIENKKLADRIAELEKEVQNLKAGLLSHYDIYPPQTDTCKHGVDDGACKECYQEELNDGGFPVKNATYWKRQYDKLKAQTKPLKCIVKDCKNHRHEGGFTGDLCNPCYEFITTGKGVYSQAYRNTQTKPLSDEEIVQIAKDCGYANAYHYNIRFARAIEQKVRCK